MSFPLGDANTGMFFGNEAPAQERRGRGGRARPCSNKGQPGQQRVHLLKKPTWYSTSPAGDHRHKFDNIVLLDNGFLVD